MALRLLVGLGNPESRYEHTRHNLGATWIKHLANGRAFNKNKKLHAYSCRQDNIELALPDVAMNHSGLAVSALMRYFKILPKELLVAHDELDLPEGVARFKFGGGVGGHRGLEDIVNNLGTKDFYRLRFGIGHPGNRQAVNAFVLSKPSSNEKKLYQSAMDVATSVLPLAVCGDWTLAMNELHSKT